MKHIKFRGMNIKGDWCYGLLAKVPPECHTQSIPVGVYISNKSGKPFAYHVRPETVGQYTGLKDKNGKEIYEGDIVYIDHPCWREEAEVRFLHGSFIFVVKSNQAIIPGWTIEKETWKLSVIGNIYEAIK